MSLFVKICGICNEGDLAAVTSLRPDAVGFVFYPPSPRYVMASLVGSWKVPAGILKVGVFVDSTPRRVAEMVAEAGLDVIQLHGAEKAADYRGMAPAIWKVVHLDAATTVAGLAGADALLIDRYDEGVPGGTGKRCDWTRAAAFIGETDCPVLLAGGLTPGNIDEAVSKVRPWGVDVSSGVEQIPGKKDIGKTERFITCCRRY